jgi:hypothetical protein
LGPSFVIELAKAAIVGVYRSLSGPHPQASGRHSLRIRSGSAQDPLRPPGSEPISEIEIEVEQGAGSGCRESVAEAFTIVGLSCLDHALSNERAVRAGDPEGVHRCVSDCAALLRFTSTWTKWLS